jgi:AGCS family alanine or glycine:cation symporter
MESFERSIPVGEVIFDAVAIIFAFSTMFSIHITAPSAQISLFGADKAHYYNYLFLATRSWEHDSSDCCGYYDIAYAFMAFLYVFTMLLLSPRFRTAAKNIFKNDVGRNNYTFTEKKP